MARDVLSGVRAGHQQIPRGMDHPFCQDVCRRLAGCGLDHAGQVRRRHLKRFGIVRHWRARGIAIGDHLAKLCAQPRPGAAPVGDMFVFHDLPA